MSTQPAARPRLHRLAERLGEVAALDGPAEAIAKWARGAIPKGPVKDTLSGVPLGHAAHGAGEFEILAIGDLTGGAYYVELRDPTGANCTLPLIIE